ncbi:golgin subfamily A member 6-like protein 2 [Telopea speciosissima]|uniref:golgin subfamily A member 6-like protein 2 n=1 Tax=Telopea speciosissima TaxID=54955 RepID=UPI001CC55BF3|nr:golgin subfamily A member 6-like protein 2 [Telopea speciosissima]
MAASRQIFRCASTSPRIKFVLTQTLRFKTTSTALSHHNQHQLEHEFSKPSEFLGSWKAPKDPKEAEANLGKLRREYAKQVKELRKQYIYEMELQKQEKQLKDEAKREAVRIAREERKAAKAAMAQVRAAERKVLEEEFRQTLLKERAEKQEYWKSREKRVEDKKKEKKELLNRQSSMWIDEQELEKKILEALVDTTPL